MNVKQLGRQLTQAAAKLENHFGDMCEFDFTVQEGKLYVLNARVGKRAPEAAIRIATDLFLEGQITGRTLVSRIAPNQVEDILRPRIDVSSKIPPLGTGLPASPGAAAGIAAFTTDSVLRLKEAGNPVVFMALDFAPEDIWGLTAAVGIVSFLGGMTSHAAVIARGMGKPCVAGVGWSFDRSRNSVSTSKGVVKEGEYITIDGTSGIVFAGRANFRVTRGLENKRLMLIARIIDVLASENELPEGHVGTAWRVRDLIMYGGSAISRPDIEHQLDKWPSHERTGGHRAFARLDHAKVNTLRRELLLFRVGRHSDDYMYLWSGLRSCLLRLLARHVGMARHPSFYRPLFDPCEAILEAVESSTWNCHTESRIQFVGEEFFSINYYVPEYLEIESIRIYWAVECAKPQELWRIDRTNPAGEKLLQGGSSILALKLVVNDATVPPTLLPRLYNYLRRKEYFWDWYEANGTSRREIGRLLSEQRTGSFNRDRLSVLKRAGLISALGYVTKAGHSLLRPSSARERATHNLKIGW